MGLLAEHRHTTGATEAKMLAKGRYWIDVEDKKLQYWQFWLEQAWINVKVITTEHYAATEPECNLLDPNCTEPMPGLSWYLFEVITPVEWDKVTASVLGYPTPTSDKTTTRDDTVDKPNPEDTLPAWHTYVKWGLIGGIGVAALWGVASILKTLKE